jgi:hypothetical protein
MAAARGALLRTARWRLRPDGARPSGAMWQSTRPRAPTFARAQLRAAVAGACGLAVLAPSLPVARAEAARRGLSTVAGGNLPAGVREVTLYQYEICPYCCKVSRGP